MVCIPVSRATKIALALAGTVALSACGAADRIANIGQRPK